MDRDALYYHFANLGLVLIGLLSIQSMLGPFATMILIPGTIAGFLISWQIKDSRPQHLDTLTGMLSLAAVVVVLSRLFNISMAFETLLRILSTALVWLTLFQSFGLKTGKSYATLQFISIILLISSVALALEEESYYAIMLAAFLFIFIFTMRLNLVCEKKRKGSTIIGDREEVMTLWQQIKVGALMFSFVLIVASLVYPFVPRFEDLSMDAIPSTLIGIMDEVPILKLLKDAPRTIKENKKARKQQALDDESKKRERDGIRQRRDDEIRKSEKDKEEKKQETTERFRSKKFDEQVDAFKVESLNVEVDKNETPLDEERRLRAELKMNDGSTIPATQLVDWKVTGTAKVSIDDDGNMTPKEQGHITVSASYLGNFSNDVSVEITEPVGPPPPKKSWVYYLVMTLLWILILLFLAVAVLFFIRSRKLSEMAIKNPREFIKEIYVTLCRGFRVYGIRRFNYVAPREFFESSKVIVSSSPEPMYLMTEGVLEARFSTHEISTRHSWQNLGLFHDVKSVVLDRDEGKHFWKKILFSILLLDVLLVPKQD